MNHNILELDSNIPFFKGYSDIRPITKGYSNDKKYCVTLGDGSQVLLKIFDLQDYESKQVEFGVLHKMGMVHVNSSRPLEIGSIEKNGMGYMILSYIKGQDAENEIVHYPKKVQYDIGVEAGLQLLKMHQCKAPEEISDWFDRKVQKHKNYMEQYRHCGYTLKYDEKVISFIDNHIELIRNRPNLFQHDDFHLGNLIIKDQQFAGVIDFNRFDWGDPIHDFLKVGLFSSEVSVPFSIGQIKGYHGNQHPDQFFWRLYALYIAMSIFSSIVWILKVKPNELDQMLVKLHRVLDDHEYFEQIKPKWYV